MSFKIINYDESIRYYFKGCSKYGPKECHVNVFQHFYDNNYIEVENNEKAFKYVIGLLIFRNADNSFCYVHSWIEKNNMVIDVTPFANISITSSTQLDVNDHEELARQLREARYMPVKSLSNANLNKQFNALLKLDKNYGSPGKTMEKLVRQWIGEVRSDPRVIDLIQKENLTFIEG